jgi:hypothetical protein
MIKSWLLILLGINYALLVRAFHCKYCTVLESPDDYCTVLESPDAVCPHAKEIRRLYSPSVPVMHLDVWRHYDTMCWLSLLIPKRIMDSS